MLANNNLQIRQVTKADEGVYRCEASVEARGEIDFVDIAVVVNGECATVRQTRASCVHLVPPTVGIEASQRVGVAPATSPLHLLASLPSTRKY